MSDKEDFKVRSGIFKASLAAFLNWLSVEYFTYGDEELHVYLVRNTGDMRQPSRMNKTKASDEAPIYGESKDYTTEFPLCRVALGEIAIDTDKGGYRRKLATKGVIIGKSLDENKIYFDSLIPVKVSLAVKFDADDLDSILTLANMLFSSLPKVSFKLLHEIGATPIEVSATIDGSFTVPQADLGNPGDPYTYETTFILTTYLGTITTMRPIREIRVSYVEHPEKETAFSPTDLDNYLLYKDVVHDYDLLDKASKYYKIDGDA